MQRACAILSSVACPDLGIYGGEEYSGFLVGKTEGKRQLGRPERKWEEIIGMNL
jgi:hypothetical protein